MEIKDAVEGLPWRRVLDVVIAVGLLALGAFFTFAIPQDVLDQLRERDALGVALLAGQTLPLIWRQTAPRAVIAAITLAWMVDRGLAYEDSIATLGLVVAIHAVGAFLPRRQALTTAGIVLGVGMAWTTVGVVTTPGVGVAQLASVFLWILIPFAIGRADASTRERITELELEQQSQDVLSREAADAAVRTERARIARELHDVVAHEITVMTLQAEGAKRQSGDANPQVTEALATISESGRKGLVEMQRMIGVLRDTSETPDADGATIGSPYLSADAHDLAPMPALSSLPALAKQVQEAGLPVELHITGGAHVPAGVELSAYRIVQESLTNALKHAGPGATALVTVKRAKSAVTVTVEDDGRGVISDATPQSGGHGLAGMRERVLTLGGSIEFGPRPGGGFRVRAVLPSHDDTVNPSRAARGAKRQDRTDTRRTRR